MTTALKLRRGTTAQHASFTGAVGEVTVDTTKKTAVVHDGSTAGGTPLAKESALATKADTTYVDGRFNTTFAFKNRIINGAMRIDQRNAGAAVTTADAYTLDRWKLTEDTDGAASVQQISDAPAGFNNSARVTVTTADASIGASQFTLFWQPVEGFNWADLGYGTASARTATLSFWVKSSLTGTFSGSLENAAGDRSYIFSYSIASANTWEQKTVTIAGDTAGTWLNTNGIGVKVFFTLAAGSSFQGSAGSWGTARFGATGTTQLMSTLNATWQITGVQLEVGSSATPFDTRAYGQELALCQRYYYVLAGQGGSNKTIGTGFYATATRVDCTVSFKVSMRALPSLVQTTGTNYFNMYSNNAVDSFNSFSGAGEISTEAAEIYTLSGVSGTSGAAGAVYTNNSSASVAFSSEL